jgi:hypothetical protein
VFVKAGAVTWAISGRFRLMLFLIVTMSCYPGFCVGVRVFALAFLCLLEFPLAFGHQPMLEATGHHPYVRRIGCDEPDDNAERHDAPEQELGRLHGPHIVTHHKEAHDRSHARHHEVHADEFRHEALANVLPIGAAHHRLHEQRLEDEQAEGEPGNVFHDKIDPHRQPKGGGDCCCENDARGVSGHAVDRRANALLPQRLRERLVLAWPRLLVRQHVDQQPERPHVERDEYEPPFHHDGFGVVAELVPRHVGRAQARQNEPDCEEVVDGLYEHCSIPVGLLSTVT